MQNSSVKDVMSVKQLKTYFKKFFPKISVIQNRPTSEIFLVHLRYKNQQKKMEA